MFEYGKKILNETGQMSGALGATISGRAVTDTLFVSPNGDNTTGKSWSKAYNTIQAALDAASTDANDCTLINIGPHATYYDIDTTGNPTWSANVILNGTHRLWAAVRNSHASATSILKFTGKASLINLAVFQVGTVDGVIFTKSGWRVRQCGFNSEALTGAATAIHLDGSSAFIRGGIAEGIEIRGHATHTKGIHLDNAKINEFHHIRIHSCLSGIHIEDADSDQNTFCSLDIGDSALGVDIDEGNNQHFEHVNFHHNTRNVDDEVGDHIWTDIHGQFPIRVYPDDFSGVTVASAAGAGAWGSLTELVAANAIDNPFRIVAVHMDPSVNQWSRVRLTGDAGTIYHDDLMFDGNRREGTAAPSGTEFIFNADTKIEGMAKVAGGGPDNIDIWLEIQEI